MKKTILFVLLGFLLFNLGFSKNKKKSKKPIVTQSIKASECITISTTLFDDKEWVTSGYNKCDDPEKIVKKILILEAENVNIKQKLILNTSDLIISQKKETLIFRTRKKDDTKPSKFNWKLIE